MYRSRKIDSYPCLSAEPNGGGGGGGKPGSAGNDRRPSTPVPRAISGINRGSIFSVASQSEPITLSGGKKYSAAAKMSTASVLSHANPLRRSSSADSAVTENMADLDSSDVMFVLKPMIISLKLLGLWPMEGNTVWTRLNTQSKVIFVYLHLYAIHLFVNWAFSLSRNVTFYVFLDNLSLFIRTGSTAWTLDMFFEHYWETLSSITHIDHFTPLHQKTSLRSLRIYIFMLVAGSWLYVTTQLGFSAWGVAAMDVQKFMNQYFYGAPTSHLPEAFLRFAMASVWTCYCIVTLSAEIFLKTFYVAVCLLLGRCARAYNETVYDVEKKEEITGMDIHHINTMHTRLSDLVINIDKNFTIEVFIWVATILLNVCIKIGAIVVSDNPSDTSSVSMDILNYLFIFIVIALTAADVAHQCDSLLPMSHRLAARCDMTDLNSLYQAKLMVAKMTNPVAKLTGWDCFTIDRPFILTMFGTILTYAVVLLQMSRTPRIPPTVDTFPYDAIPWEYWPNATTVAPPTVDYSWFNATWTNGTWINGTFFANLTSAVGFNDTIASFTHEEAK